LYFKVLFILKKIFFIMNKSFALFVFLMGFVLAVSSCNNGEYQYDVYVRNQTGGPLKVAFKSDIDRKGIVEETVNLEDGAFHRIINSIDIKVPENEDYGGTSAQHSYLVAEYVNAYKKDKASKVKWNDEKIEFIKTDIGQAEFVITYTPDDF